MTKGLVCNKEENWVFEELKESQYSLSKVSKVKRSIGLDKQGINQERPYTVSVLYSKSKEKPFKDFKHGSNMS